MSDFPRFPLGSVFGAATASYQVEGAAREDDRVADGAVHDPDRVAYLRDHLTALRAATDGGVDVRGHHVWSLPDTFEWAFGYGKRFGIVHVDHATQRRIPKDSYHRYRRMTAARRP